LAKHNQTNPNKQAKDLSIYFSSKKVIKKENIPKRNHLFLPLSQQARIHFSEIPDTS